MKCCYPEKVVLLLIFGLLKDCVHIITLKILSLNNMSYFVLSAELGESILNVLGCLVPFLENDLLDSLPYTVASTLAIFPPTLHKDTIDLLCSNLLPMTLGKFFLSHRLINCYMCSSEIIPC